MLKVEVFPLAVFCVAVSCVLTANFIFYVILGEVNGRMAPGKQISMLFVSVRYFEVVSLHRDLFPSSRKRVVMTVVGATGLMSMLTAFFMGFP